MSLSVYIVVNISNLIKIQRSQIQKRKSDVLITFFSENV